MPPAGLPVSYQKGHKSQPSWTKQVLVPIPGVPTRRLRIIVPNSTRISRKRGLLLICLACLAMVLTVTALRKGFGRQERWEPFTPREPSTLVYRRDDLQRIWEWEIASGHYPSKRSSACLLCVLCMELIVRGQYLDKSASSRRPQILRYHHHNVHYALHDIARHRPWLRPRQTPTRSASVRNAPISIYRLLLPMLHIRLVLLPAV